MAVVNYEVQCRIIHPDTRQPISFNNDEYEPYNIVIEKSNSQNKPDDLVGTVSFPLSNRSGIEQSILIQALNTGVGHSLRGYEQDYRFLDLLMNSDIIVARIQKILLYQTEIADIAKRIEEDTVLRDEVVKQIKRDHNGAVLNYTTGIVSGDYYTHNPVPSYVTVSGCRSSVKENTPTFGESYRYAHSAQCNENIRLFEQYVTKIQTNTAQKTIKQNDMLVQQNVLIKEIQAYVQQAELNYIANRSVANDNPLYNALFLFKGTKQTYSRQYQIIDQIDGVSAASLYSMNGTTPASNIRPSVLTLARRIQFNVYQDTFDIIQGNIWNTTSIHDSQPAAQKAAAYLSKSVGMENVRVVKIVPLDTKVIIEGQN